MGHPCLEKYCYISNDNVVVFLPLHLGLTNAFIKGARDNGAEVIENCPVEEIIVEDGKVTGVKTNQGLVSRKKGEKLFLKAPSFVAREAHWCYRNQIGIVCARAGFGFTIGSGY